jgi:hypothetical protein
VTLPQGVLHFECLLLDATILVVTVLFTDSQFTKIIVPVVEQCINSGRIKET